MKKILLFSLMFVIIGCSPKLVTKMNYSEVTQDLLKEIKEESLKKNLYIIASDKMQGRETGSEGQKKAGNYMINFYKKNNIGFPTGAINYYQPIPSNYFKKAFSPKLPDSENIWAFIKGSEKPDEILVISAHYDHVGMKNEAIFNGADDDASGTVAVMEIAQAFQKAIKMVYKPKRSILFLHVTAEEHGLHGSRFYSENPLFPIENHITNINIDMIGRRGYGKESNDNYIYVIGSDRLSTDLHRISEEVNTKYTNLELDYKYNDLNDPNRFYYRSDHYNFAKKGIPAIFYFNGVHDDYHKATDTPDKIDYPQLTKRTKLAFALAWELANCEEKPKVDKDGK
jgi:Zn-dependent M28 family amino/carboxypeptidase